MAEKGQACDDCGLLFDTVHDVQRHVKRGWCPETTQSKKKKIEEDTDEDDGPIEDNEAYKHLWKVAKKEVKDRFDRLYDRYLSDGENENDAADMARDRGKQFLSAINNLTGSLLVPLEIQFSAPKHRATNQSAEGERSQSVFSREKGHKRE